MTTSNDLIQNLKQPLPSSAKKRAYEIETLLLSKSDFNSIRGVKIAFCPELVRFKLNRSFRYIWRINRTQREPLSIIHKNVFNREIRRLALVFQSKNKA